MWQAFGAPEEPIEPALHERFLQAATFELAGRPRLTGPPRGLDCNDGSDIRPWPWVYPEAIAHDAPDRAGAVDMGS